MTGYGIYYVTGNVYGDTRENSLDGSYQQRSMSDSVVLSHTVFNAS